MIRQEVVRPAVQDVLVAAEASRPPGGVSGAEELGPLLQKLLAAAHSSCRPLLEATLAPQSGLTGYGLLGNAILAEVDQALADGLPGLLSSVCVLVLGCVCQTAVSARSARPLRNMLRGSGQHILLYGAGAVFRLQSCSSMLSGCIGSLDVELASRL